MKLALKISDSAVGEPCGICGNWVEPLGSGLVATLADSWQLVCGDCAAAHEPRLLAVLGLVEASEDVLGVLIRPSRKKGVVPSERAVAWCV